MVQSLRVYFTPTEYCTSDGRIFREAHSYKREHKGRIITTPLKEKELVGPKLSQKGYKRIQNKGKVHFVHSIVAYCFLGPQSKDVPQVNHIDGNKLNNAASNLEYVSNLENRTHAVGLGLVARGEKLSRKLKEGDIIEIRIMAAFGYYQSEIARQFNLCQQTVSNICLFKTWTHI